MLQGHFIDTLLNPIYRDKTNAIYNLWSYFRGITAPVFFTISGLVFSYLLLRSFAQGTDAKRIKKGLFRGLLLLIIGYSLRINFISLFTGYFSDSLLVVDVLQCIGLSLICLVSLHVLFKKHTYLYSIALCALGCFCFVTEPLYRNLHTGDIPLFIANFISTKNGSVFTILPWFGYSAFGALLSTIFFRNSHKIRFKLFTIISFFLVGWLLVFKSSVLLLGLSRLSQIELFSMSADYNYLFTRLGNVLILFGVFYTLERFLKQSIINKIGGKTLSIYVIHFILLYGSYTGYGLKRFFDKSLDPMEAIFGALLFMIFVCFVSFYYAKTNHYVYNLFRKIIDKL